MTQWTIYALSGVAVVAVASYGLFASKHILRRIIAANLMGSGVFLVFVALARRTATGRPDPVPHALVLTGIVVSVSATACALSLARRLSRAEGARSPRAVGDRGEPDAP
jgi:multicomponent Na+:H+ antiporter subunit C